MSFDTDKLKLKYIQLKEQARVIETELKRISEILLKTDSYDVKTEIDDKEK